jgi:drug/metabolite transporter (DMT)-like permease
MTKYYVIIYLAVFLAAAAHIMLKYGSGRGGLNLIIMRLNLWVVLGMGAMVLSMLLNVRALSVVPLRDMAFIMPTVYVLVPLFARIFLKERLTRQTIVGTMFIIAGVVLFNLPTVRLF